MDERDERTMTGRRSQHLHENRVRPTRAVGRGIAALAMATGLVVAGCGDDDSPTSAQSTASTTTTPPSTTPTSEMLPLAFDIYLSPSEIGDDCTVVIGAARQSTSDDEVSDALSQLLAGPTGEEAAAGLGSWFSAQTEGMLRSVTVEAGVAHVDFEDFSGIIPNASTSCGSAALLAQLDSTVLQFEGIDEVVYSFDGDRVAFYEWLQRSAPE